VTPQRRLDVDELQPLLQARFWAPVRLGTHGS
jgi:hypothetical protein